MIKNTVKKILHLCSISILLMSCSTTKISEKTTSVTTKINSAQGTANQVKGSYDTVKGGYDSATKLREQYSKDSLAAPTNIPPPNDIEQLPKYGSWSDRFFGRVIHVKSRVEKGANQNFPIVFDLVFVKDDQTYSTLSITSTKNWFRLDEVQIAELKKNKSLMEVHQLTVLPEQNTYDYLVRVPSGIKAGLLYVRLIGNENLYPTLFDPYQNFEIDFSANNFELHQNNSEG